MGNSIKKDLAKIGLGAILGFLAITCNNLYETRKLAKELEQDKLERIVQESTKPKSLETQIEGEFSREKENELAIKEYVINNLGEIVGEIEREENIKFSKIPEISYEIFNGNKKGIDAIYDSRTEKMNINPTNLFAVIENPERLRKIVKHELIHAYADQVREEEGLGNWVFAEDYEGDVIGAMFINEGIAEHYSRTYLLEKKFTENKWPVIKEQFILQYYRYVGGEYFAGPILEKLGIREGIIYLSKNFPKDEELKDPKSYRNRIYTELYIPIPKRENSKVR